MFIEERHQEILKIIEDQGRISLSIIQSKFNISVDSARRDLRILESKGLLKRTHGGAIPAIPRGYSIPESVTHRDITNIKPNYMAIALKAVSLIKEHDVVHITGGSVGYFMVQNLPRNFEFTVVVNSIILADVLRLYTNVTTIMIGGILNSKGHCKEQLAIDMIKHLRFDKAFITSAAVSTTFGASIQSPSSVGLIRAFMDAAKSNIGLYPNEKIELDSILHIYPIERFNTIITDWDVTEENIEKLKETDIELIIVEEDKGARCD
ncbi:MULTISPECIES: DeoR/GlpR family DNA-binding transcription regulator [unclassified Fusibacter]|uniref:DeoR/GlpR family DNA-binding transcription regulator n=1 Tax=unclassified Fusibacter TaxID=2624464 RepID=UPI0010104985|nr:MULTISPECIES: DeoR/GlpR family DNA-binding transcription regulator [unclassified Fusibacter]MCK8061470.1 DeoR/GlpR family DNA-binding transcription regulator [Fusibacter sp. A2]NPE23655.1 DeoR/GlpR transcriptional regulator [Fusibacter sp. A1]RXV58834.1 DeoR/GlpR transcriptional regulator [Fusibacter sp. A1]